MQFYIVLLKFLAPGNLISRELDWYLIFRLILPLSLGDGRRVDLKEKGQSKSVSIYLRVLNRESSLYDFH